MVNNQVHGFIDQFHREILEAVAFVRSHYPWDIDLAVFSGTGLGDVLVNESWEVALDYDELPFVQKTEVPGHSGRLLIGQYKGLRLAFFKGRIHYYEGHSIQEVTRMARIAQFLKIPRVLFLNAAGGLRNDLKAGDIVPLADHIYQLPENPLRGMQNPIWGNPFPDPKNLYRPGLNILKVAGLALSSPGVYVCLPGPQLETNAEIEFWRSNGADLVGMSTIPEVLVCAQGGMEVLVWSIVTNTFEKQTHEVKIDDVVAAARSASGALNEHLTNLIDFLARTKPQT